MNRKIVFGQGRVTIRHGAARCSDCAGQGIVKRWADSDVRHDSASVQSRAVQRRLARRARPTPSAANGGRQPEAAAGGPEQNHPQPARVQQGNPLGSTCSSWHSIKSSYTFLPDITVASYADDTSFTGPRD